MYNDRGQRISRSQPGGSGALTTAYEYDEVGNLWRVVLPDATVVSYRVDGLGRRVARFVDGVADAYWLYQDGLNPVAQLDGAGNVTQQYVYATRLNVPDLIIEGGVTYRVLTDQVGSVRRVVNTATGASVLEREYSPYGALEFSNGSFGQPFGYAGGLEDSLTGLVRFGARDYDPEVGRWTAKDPILTDGGVNLYEYGASAPQMYVDPCGAAPWTVIHRAYKTFAGIIRGRRVRLDVASSLIRNGGDLVVRSKNEAVALGKAISRRCGGGGHVDIDPRHVIRNRVTGATGRGNRHLHVLGPGGDRLPGHIFYDIAAYLLLFGDVLHETTDTNGDGAIDATEWLEFANPLPIPLDPTSTGIDPLSA